MSESGPECSVRVENVDGKLVEIMSIPAASHGDTDFLIVVIPGNPGIVEYYTEYCQALWIRFRGSVTVTSLGYIAHSVEPLYPWHRWHNLNDQLVHLANYVDSMSTQYRKVVLVGHSIGAHMSLETMYKAPHQVAGVIGIQPYLTNNVQSSEQRFCRLLVNLRPVVWFVSFLAQLVALLPRGIRLPFLRGRLLSMGLEHSAVDVTVRAMRFSTVLNYALMGMTELDQLEAQPDWAKLLRYGNRVGLFYGATDDIWAPPHHMEAVRREAPTVAAIAQDPSHGHMFCVTKSSSMAVADITVALMQKAALITPKAAGFVAIV